MQGDDGEGIGLHGQKRSVWVCALHKSASTFISRYMRFIKEEYFSDWELLSPDNNVGGKWPQATRPYVFAVRRTYAPLPNGCFKGWDPEVTLLIRDPRDVLVSEYFSAGFIHSDHGFPEESLKLRNAIRTGELTIDDFVIMSALEGVPFSMKGTLLEKTEGHYQEFRAQMKQRDLPFYTTRYEDLVTNFSGWNDRMLEILRLEDPEGKVWNQFYKEFDVSKIKERGEKMTHRRSILPGDHKQKLKPETIERLNEIFEPYLKRFEYL